MSKKLFVGNLPFAMVDEALGEHFTEFGAVEEAIIITDRETGRSRGFGFVTMTNPEDADKATLALNGKEVGGRKLLVNEAREKGAKPAPRK